MRTLAVLLLMLAAVRADDAKPIAFEKGDLSKTPRGWTSARTGEGEGSVWKLVEDKSTPSNSGVALTQTAAGPTALYNLCMLDDSKLKDGQVSVSIKAVAGKIDQGGGVVWRYQDEKNYYVCRYNPLEENFRVYYVKNGKRTQLATKENVELPKDKWFTVAIKHEGDAISCSLNGTKHLEVLDKTFEDAGKVGLWSKADAVSHFDQFHVKVAKP